MEQLRMTRRHLLSAMAVAGIGGALPIVGRANNKDATAGRRKDSLGVALIGLGYYSTHLLAPGLQQTRNCHLAGIVTGSPEKIPEWQAKHSIPDRNVYNYDNFDQIASNPDIDVVYIATPNDLHKPLTLRAAAAGKHVWCEKPMAMNAAEAQEMIDACKAAGVQLTVGYRMRHEPTTHQLMAMAKDKPYGRFLKVRADAGFHAYDDVDPANKPWRLVAKHGGGAMFDMGVYSLNAARYLTGLEPVAVSARSEVHRAHLFQGVDETTHFTLEFPGDLIAECSTSFGKNMNLLRADCERGWYELNPFQAYNGIAGRTSDGKTFSDQVPHQQARQMDNDALAILEGTSPRVPGEEGLRDMVIVDAIYASAAADGKRIAL